MNHAMRILGSARSAGAVLLGLALLIAVMARATAYELTLVDLEGNREVLAVVPDSVFAPRVSPDGGRIVYETIEQSEDGWAASLWVADTAAAASPRQLPVLGGPINWAAIWTADGERLVFVVSGGGADAIHTRRADGSGEALRLVDARAVEVQLPDSTRATYLTLTADGDYGIGVLDLVSGETEPLIDAAGSAQHSSSVSPDGRWIAYASNETGRYEVWMEPLPPTGERHRLTRNGGAHPMWSPEGDALYFDRDHRMYRIALSLHERVSAGEEVALPISGFEQGELRRQFDLMPDGRRFLMLFPANR